ncbi:MAG: MFS transporter [bacterium]|nr:MFS transporter [bacterium]
MTSRSHSQDTVSLLPWFFWGGAAVFYCYQFLLRVSPTVITKELSEYLSVESCALGVLLSSYYYGYSALQVPGGLIIDRFGPRRPLTVACLLCAVGSFIFSVSDTITFMWIGRFLIGVGSAFGFLSCVKLASLWFPTEKLAILIGWTLVLGTAGGVGGGWPLAKAVEAYGWKQTVLGLSFFGIFWALFIFFIVRDKKKILSTEPREPLIKEKSFSLKESLSYVLSNPKTWVIGLYGGLMYVPLSGFADLWGTPFIVSVYGVGKADAASAALTFYIGIGVGCPFSAIISGYLNSYLKPMRYGAIGVMIFFLILLYAPIPFWATYPILFAAGFFSAAQFMAFVTVNILNPKKYSATATGVHNMLCMISGIIFQPLIGYILDSLATTVAGAHVYTPENYRWALLIVPVALMFSWLITFCFNDGCAESREQM